MRHLLQARHLSPIYGSQTPLAPENDDMMVIDEVPDIFHAGHVHVVDLDLYRGVLILNSGAWQHQTPFQAGVGMTPTPGLATGEIYTVYKEFCTTVRQHELTQRRVTQMLSEIELSGIISGRIVYQGIHGNTKKYKLTIPRETVKETFKNDLTFEDIL